MPVYRYQMKSKNYLNTLQGYLNLKIKLNRFQPVNIELDSKLKAFIPDYIPAVGEVDAFLKMPRPDGQTETLGLAVIVKVNSLNVLRMNQH